MDFPTIRANGGANLPGTVSNSVSTMRRARVVPEAPVMPDLRGMVVCKTTGVLKKIKGLPTISMSAVGPVVEAEELPSTLKFHAYFVENSYVHKMMIHYHLTDDTMEITEGGALHLSGAKGKATKFVKRHRFPKSELEFYGVADLYIDQRVTIYGREFHIVDAPPSTRAYVARMLGLEMGSALPLPQDMYDGGLPSSPSKGPPPRQDASVMTGESMQYPKMQSQMSKFLEASLGNTVNNKGLRSFLENGKQVLRFVGVWDNSKSFGGDRQVYNVNYYVADDTIEVLEQKAPNDGKSANACLLGRSKLPKAPESFMGMPGRENELDDTLFYKWRDLEVGMDLNIWGRMVTLVGADDRTRAHYLDQGQGLAPDLDAQVAVPTFEVEEQPPGKRVEVPGISTPSARAPKTRADQPTMSLTFSARMDTNRIDAKHRRFVFSVFLKDGSVQVREPPLRNSGVMGGMWLSKQRIPKHKGSLSTTDPSSSASDSPSVYFTPADFFVGAKLVFNSAKFIIIDVDEHSLKYMETNPGFPLSSYDECLQFVRGACDAHDIDTGRLFDLLGDGTKSEDEVVAALCGIGMESDEAKQRTMDALCSYWGYNWGMEADTFMMSSQRDDTVIPSHIARTIVRAHGSGKVVAAAAVASAIAEASVAPRKWP